MPIKRQGVSKQPLLHSLDKEGAFQVQKSNDTALADLIETLQSIDINSQLAKLNETSITDNNGGRIEL